MSTSPHLRELRLSGTQLGDAGLLLLVPYLEVSAVQNCQTSRRQASQLLDKSHLHCITAEVSTKLCPQAAAVRGL